MTVDEYLTEMAGLIGCTQHQIMHEYYWVDLVRVAQIIRKQEAIKKIELLNIINSKNLEEKDYKEMIRRYMREAEIKEKTKKFDRDAFEELRSLK
ncbi:hypothetical protein BK703_16875 [Bacillus thuringiensis serovar silo]|nr:MULTISPECIES: hypothetical protein [Bacillus cereus group]MED3275397.1 hypothetical protein [Bacillus thuringiensis]PKJ52700.1 hypothetical protein CWE34_26635 [Bacillus sp. SN10]OTW55312.1 hypothetical protein BK703_16875 [Bacillus thuringiensis serovar silo]OTW74256.1 hypothetical protein BK700_01170 [Bacillus thuringiensis serovar toguchini]PFQ72433.1 hypothetical protein COK15_28255 [Bacillus cereus]